MLKIPIRRSAVLATTLLLLSVVARAQDQPAPVNSQPVSATVPQAVTAVLAGLPEADTLIYINPQRILNEAAPKVMSEADVAKMRQQFSDLKRTAGVDPSRIDLVVLAIRFRKPAVDLNFQGPEFLIVSSGDFSAESLLTLARLALQEKLREEKYGSKTLTLSTIDDIAKQAETNPFLKSFSEIALVALNSYTIAAGSVSYIKAAVDAGEGRERISQDTLNSLMRDPNALISMAGSPWTAFAKSFGLMGTDAAPRAAKCDSRLGDYYAAVTLEGPNFKLQGAMNADNSDTAKIISNLLGGLMKTVPGENTDAKSFPSMLRRINLAAKENEVVLQAEFPQQMVLDFIREQMKPKASVTVSKPPESTTPARKARRVVRKRRSGT
ncbi:MAG TPA: hypothetical protein VE135_20505 [Pyrinomonadaceae bacterium]|nr:hypothetical protein [Pyrinomonadaceae bacterium]